MSKAIQSALTALKVVALLALLSVGASLAALPVSRTAAVPIAAAAVAASIRPRTGKIPAATAYSGISRSILYELAAKHPGLFLKNGGATLVSFDVLDQIVDALPHAKIGK